MDQKGDINLKFSDGLSIFDNHYGYPEINDQEMFNETINKAKDIQYPQAQVKCDFLILQKKSLDFFTNHCQYL